MAKADRASYGPRVSPHSEAKAKSKENNEKSKGKSKGTKGAIQGAKGSHKGKTSKAGLSGFENSKSDASSETQDSGHARTTDIFWNNGWNCDEWNDAWSFDEGNDDWSSVGWHEAWEQSYDTSASSFSLGGLDLGATSCPKRFEWVKMNLDTGAAVNTFPLNFGPEGAGDGRFHRRASGELIPDGGAWQFKGYDENGLLRSLNGRLTGVHKVLCSAAEIARVGRQDFYLGHDGYMIPIIFNFYLNREVKSTETNNVNNAQQSGNEMAEQCARKSNENSESRRCATW